MEAPRKETGFDRAAAITRSLLGYGVLAGVFYVTLGLGQAFMRDGFDLSRHSLSLLANGPWGWVQTLNFAVTGLMVLAASVGIARALRPARLALTLVAIYGGSLIVAGVFPADPMDGFPPGAPTGAADEMSTAGFVHLAAGGIGFVALAAAFVALGASFAARGHTTMARSSRLSAAVLLLAFLAGAATATSILGVVLLWIAVLVGWGWLATTSVALYRAVPHPDLHRRPQTP
ncbi:DUF998 domain-containing protein [Nesterenkonia sphaerica]|uniref:DUF998 domain-containing protein n=1 Tax=Nesterenkonia sphaerica TaxID=1804988 RepID=A0A5R8ZXT6_9MICC|nr:DUF998 domain-containing protein [Nesterenkonia sphaerica]TLP71238.1 DUF998 domain-containing protein [Nesterenkonia sphaerica]